jgi:AhpD family alkylhydroperoxidase
MSVPSHVGVIVGEQFVHYVHDSYPKGRHPKLERTNMEHAHEVREELRPAALALRGLIPDVMRGYGELSRAAMAEGTLSTATKELIALAIAMTRECDGCIVAHSRSAARMGVARQDIAEAIGVTIMMNGGPGTVWGPRALRSFDEAVAEFADEGTI